MPSFKKAYINDSLVQSGKEDVGFAAEKIETNQEVTPQSVKKKEKLHFLDEKFFGKTKRAAVLETGELFAVVLCLFAAARQYYGRPVEDSIYFILGALFLYELSYRAPTLFYPIWKAWMGLGWVLEATMSKVILVISWFVMVVPIGLLMKATGQAAIKTNWKEDCLSYWEEKSPQDFKLLERQF